MAELFATERGVVTKHLGNIFRSGELELKSNVQRMHITGSDRPVSSFNLDVAISVGSRVNSKWPNTPRPIGRSWTGWWDSSSTIWLDQKQITEVFATERSAVTKHLRNIFASGELRKKSACAFSAHTAVDGKTYQVEFCAESQPVEKGIPACVAVNLITRQNE